ncbi:cytochrome P450 CYP94D108 [Cornus florida]|uniref:cytochrome P450 CYP94D108 n=1 Tax=Cornus florida TaxID=4283 RepID=UPI0028990503|nr:cytochrome P450 CYP94D108 [Cornus florida]
MELFSLQTLLFISIFSLYLYRIFLHPKGPKPKSSTTTTGFKKYPLVGSLPEFLLNRHRFLDWTTAVLSRCPTNSAVFHRPGNVHGIITANPSNVEHMLKTHFENYPKGPRFITLLQDFLGRGIFNSDGDLWKVQRKTASYEFNTKSLRNFVIQTVSVEIQTRLIRILQDSARTNRVLDMQDVLERFAFDSICKVAFNVDPGCLGGDGTAGGEFMAAFDEAATLSAGRFMYALPYLYRIKKFFNVGSEIGLRNSISTVHDFADKIIRSRMEERAERKDEDLLSRFIGTEEDSPEFLRDIVISFILAGRDTTSSALSWFFWLLSSKPDVEKRILQELESIRVQYGKERGATYSFDELRRMHYMQAAISESLRLYPPVPVDTKLCQDGDVMPDGTVVGKGWFVTYHTYAMGRMEGIWGKDCYEFRPERWMENGTCRQESPFRFPVFHAGPRMCLGKDMAYIQMKSIVASVMERFVIDVQDKDTCPEHLLSLTLRMKGGLPVKVKERCVDWIN